MKGKPEHLSEGKPARPRAPILKSAFMMDLLKLTANYNKVERLPESQ